MLVNIGHGVTGSIILEMVNQPVSRTIVTRNGTMLLKFRINDLGQLLAEFDSPLVERVDIPNNALRENLVFVECDQDAESFRRQLVEKNRVGRAISSKDLMRDQRFQRLPLQPVSLEFLAYFVSGLAFH